MKVMPEDSLVNLYMLSRPREHDMCPYIEPGGHGWGVGALIYNTAGPESAFIELMFVSRRVTR